MTFRLQRLVIRDPIYAWYGADTVTQCQPQAEHVTSDTGSYYMILLRLIYIIYSSVNISGELGRHGALLEANHVL